MFKLVKALKLSRLYKNAQNCRALERGGAEGSAQGAADGALTPTGRPGSGCVGRFGISLYSDHFTSSVNEK